jgi:hypothetical protein
VPSRCCALNSSYICTAGMRRMYPGLGLGVVLAVTAVTGDVHLDPPVRPLFVVVFDLTCGDVLCCAPPHPLPPPSAPLAPSCLYWRLQAEEGPCFLIGPVRKGEERAARTNHCFDVNGCAAQHRAEMRAAGAASRPPRYALVLTHTLETAVTSRFRPETFWSVSSWQQQGVEAVIVVPTCPVPHRPSSGRFCNLESMQMLITNYRPPTQYMDDYQDNPIHGKPKVVRCLSLSLVPPLPPPLLQGLWLSLG